MEQVNEPMQVGRFLELLNKSPRTEDEERDLQQELLRQAKEKADSTAESQAETTQVDTGAEAPVDTAEVTTQEAPAQEQTQPEVAQDAPSTGTEPAPAAEYSLSQLCVETNEAVAYLQTQNKTIAIEMAIAAYMQAAYWLKLAGE